MAKAQEHKRTMRQRRRFRARQAVWLERNSTAHAPGSEESFEGSYQCHYCSRFFRRKKITRDHIVPKAQNGADEAFNLTWACKGCNQEKGSSWPECPCEFCHLAVVMHKKIRIAQGFDVELDAVSLVEE